MGKRGKPPRGTKGVRLLVEKLDKNGQSKNKFIYE
jgi:hypothetical protein